jgi:hypothetical protein
MTSLQVNDKIHVEPSKYLWSLFSIRYFIVNEIPVTSTSLVCLLNPAFHYNGKFIMQIPEVTS